MEQDSEGYTRLMMTNVVFDQMETTLLNLLNRAAAVMRDAGVPHRIVGGVAVYLHVSSAGEGAGRLTRDVDIAVRRQDLNRIAEAASQHGFIFRHTAGPDMLVDAERPQARTGVHLVFSGEKVRPDYPDAVPEISGEVPMIRGYWLMPVPDLVRMKLTSFRLKDQVHIQDMDEVGLITPEIAAGLPDVLRERLARVRAA
jgi:hypothetical protein